MTTHPTVLHVEVFNLVTGEWLAYPFMGSRPGFTLVEAPNGGTVWIANGGVRFNAKEKS